LALKAEFSYGFDRRSALAEPVGEKDAGSVFIALATKTLVTAAVRDFVHTANTGNTDFSNSLQWSHGLALKLVFFPAASLLQ